MFPAIVSASAPVPSSVAVQLGRNIGTIYRQPSSVAVQLGRHFEPYRPDWTAIARRTHNFSAIPQLGNLQPSYIHCVI